LSQEAWQKSDFYELDLTNDLVQNNHMDNVNGLTRVKHPMRYEKNCQLITVLFRADNDFGQDQDDALVIKFARKAQNQKNLDKLQESKREALKIIKSSLQDQSFTLQERLKQRKLARLKARQGGGAAQKKRPQPVFDEDDQEFDYVDVDQENERQKTSSGGNLSKEDGQIIFNVK
jgi:hypothetical protein